MSTPTTTIPVLPPTPDPDDPENFEDEALTWSEALGPWGAAVQAVGEETAAAKDVVVTSAGQVANALVAAHQAAAAAATSAEQSAVISGAGKWVPGDYAQGAAVWSPLSFLTYRRIPVGITSSAVDPSIDKANWRLTGSMYSLPQKELNTALDPDTGLPHQLLVGMHYIVLHPLAECLMPADAVQQEVLRITNRSGATTPILRRNGSRFDEDDDDMQLDSTRADKTFTKGSATRGWF
ncbi:MAG: hypothetical protein KKG67_20430 [Gammaproteobacteria bacterium]|nr:hypothetical protein [Gammaproteobacteria bacterium]